MAPRDSRAEGGKVDLLKRAPGDHDIHGRRLQQRVANAVDLLVISREVLDLGDHVLALDSPDLGSCKRAGEKRVLAQRLCLPPPLRRAHDVHRRSKQQRVPCPPPLPRVPCRPGRRGRPAPGCSNRLGSGNAVTCVAPSRDPLGPSVHASGGIPSPASPALPSAARSTFSSSVIASRTRPARWDAGSDVSHHGCLPHGSLAECRCPAATSGPSGAFPAATPQPTSAITQSVTSTRRTRPDSKPPAAPRQ